MGGGWVVGLLTSDPMPNITDMWHTHLNCYGLGNTSLSKVSHGLS
jgi:hypothetical protein